MATTSTLPVFGQITRDYYSQESPKVESYLVQALQKCGQCKEHVVIRLDTISNEKIQMLENDGFRYQTSYDSYVYGEADLMTVLKIAKLPFVKFISVQGWAYGTAILSEGLSQVLADVAQTGGLTGVGVKVGVIDVGFDTSNPEIKNNIKEFRSFASSTADTRHGTAVSEIIIDIAPSSELYLYAVGRDGDILQAIDWAITRGVKIISMSLGSITIAPHDGTSPLSRKLEDARAKGAIPIVAAGNEARSHWRGRFSDTDRDGWHNFEGSSERNAVLYGNERFCAKLIWDDWPVSSQDYDLYLFDGGNIVEKSTNLQLGLQPPGEILCYEPTLANLLTARKLDLAIVNRSATRSVNFDLTVYKGALTKYVQEGSVDIPGDSKGALTVGAIHWDPRKRPSSTIEPYSSQGPTADGRIKPDVIAPSCVSTTAYGSSQFCGTSASTPHVAAAAALLLSGNPTLTPDDIQTLFERGAVDLGEQGKDNVFGSGGARVTHVSFDVNPRPGSITVDGSVFQINSFQKIFVWKPGSTHTASANPISISEDERRGFKQWSLGGSVATSVITYDGAIVSYSAIYDTEYRVRVVSSYGQVQGSGWYLKGTSAPISITTLYDHGNSTRRVFIGWTGNIQSTSPSITFVVDAPKTLFANWKKQYQLITLGLPAGSSDSWFDVGSTVTITAPNTKEYGNETKHIFDRWAGDASGQSSSISVVVDSPKRIIAEYKTQYYLNAMSQFAAVNGSGWYFRGSQVRFQVTNSTWDHGNFTRRVFEGWLGDIRAKEVSGVIIIDTPKKIIANWTKQYFVKVISDLGKPFGNGWQNADSSLQISVDPVINHGNRTRHVFSQWLVDKPPKAFETAKVTIVIDQPFTAEARWGTQYELVVSDRAFLLNRSELWYDRSASARIGLYNTLNGTGERRNLAAYVIDGSEQLPVPRRSSGVHNISVVMDKPHELSPIAATQYRLSVIGGSDIVLTPSPTLDNWYDSGDIIEISTDRVWDIVPKVGRKSLSGFSIDGTFANLERGETRFAVTQILMAKSREVQFFSTDQVWIEVLSEFGNPRGIGWVDSGAMVEVFVEPQVDQGNRTRRVFLNWQSDQIIAKNQFQATADGSKTYTAIWKTQYAHTLSFTDSKGRPISPNIVVITSNGIRQNVSQLDKVWVDRGSFSLEGVYWRGINVGPAESPQFPSFSPREFTQVARVYDLTLFVKDTIGVPVPFASVSIRLANRTTAVLQSAIDGRLELNQLPLENYEITVNSFGQFADQRVNVLEEPTPEIRIGISIPIMAPILVGVAIITTVFFRRAR
ncbi:MAG: S8 family serine peptidase [Thaumarchaeota archaeon]|nr:S8 family serine peptidase [Nitrososphaerota archaeon]